MKEALTRLDKVLKLFVILVVKYLLLARLVGVPKGAFTGITKTVQYFRVKAFFALTYHARPKCYAGK